MIVACACLIHSGCGCKKQPFSFGEDYELSGSEFDSVKLAEVERRTGLTFPPGSEGAHFFNFDSGIDDSFAAKIFIPSDRVDEFKRNAVFEIEDDYEPSTQIGRGKGWWQIDSLEAPIHRTQNLPDAELLELSLGIIGGKHVVFISWLHSY